MRQGTSGGDVRGAAGPTSRARERIYRAGSPRRRVRGGRSPGRSAGYSGPVGGRGDDYWDPALYRLVVPSQDLISRVMGHDPNARPEEYLPVVRPYGLFRMAWAIWREVPDAEAREALRVARRVRGEGEAEVFKATRSLVGYMRRRLLVRHHLRARLEKVASGG